MSRAASKSQLEALHKSLASKLKTALESEEAPNAALLQVARQFLRDQNISCAKVGDEATADELGEALGDLQDEDFPSFPQ